jgi:hypothetical protein
MVFPRIIAEASGPTTTQGPLSLRRMDSSTANDPLSTQTADRYFFFDELIWITVRF